MVDKIVCSVIVCMQLAGWFVWSLVEHGCTMGM